MTDNYRSRYEKVREALYDIRGWARNRLANGHGAGPDRPEKWLDEVCTAALLTGQPPIAVGAEPPDAAPIKATVKAMADVADAHFARRRAEKRAREEASVMPEDLIRDVHEAMQSAPHDGMPYRQARAAVAAILADMDKRGVR